VSGRLTIKINSARQIHGDPDQTPSARHTMTVDATPSPDMQSTTVRERHCRFADINAQIASLCAVGDDSDVHVEHVVSMRKVPGGELWRCSCGAVSGSEPFSARSAAVDDAVRLDESSD
jgi:hypothetical protein